MKQNVVIHSRPSRVLLCEVVQVLPYPHASKPSSRCCYLQPSHHPISTCWFSAIPLGHYSLGRTISRTCKVAGIVATKPITLCMQLQPPGCTSLEWMNSWSWKELEIVALRCSQLQKNLRQALSDILNCSKKTQTDSSKEICSVPTLPAVASSYSEYH